MAVVYFRSDTLTGAVHHSGGRHCRAALLWHDVDMAAFGTAAREEHIDAVMEASRAMVAVVAQSLAEAEVAVTLPQWRALVVVERHGPAHMTAIAEWMGVHPSNATRACEVLLKEGLLSRREDPVDRRRQVVSLTHEGRHFVDSLLASRRRALAVVVDRVPLDRRDRLSAAMRDFAEAVGDAANTSPPQMPGIH